MNNVKTDKLRHMKTNFYDRTVKFRDAISKVTFPDMTKASPAQKKIITTILKWGDR